MADRVDCRFTASTARSFLERFTIDHPRECTAEDLFSDNDSQLFLDILAGVVDRDNYHLLVENLGLVSLLASAS